MRTTSSLLDNKSAKPVQPAGAVMSLNGHPVPHDQLKHPKGYVQKSQGPGSPLVVDVSHRSRVVQDDQHLPICPK